MMLLPGSVGVRLVAWALATTLIYGCGTGSGASRPDARSRYSNAHPAASVAPSTRRTRPRPTHPRPTRPRLLEAATATEATGLTPAVTWRGRTAVWIARRSDLVLLSFDQRLVRLRLHSGTVDAGATGWRWGPEITGAERRLAVAAFNGGFKLSTGAGGFESGGRTAVALQAGLGSIVTYANGHTDIGAWDRGVPAPGLRVASVRQNLTLLIDHGRAAGDIGCLSCWGATLGGVADPARSALGITGDGHLIWTGGEHLTVGALANSLLAAHVVRAVELDINPEWVAAYLYAHPAGRRPPAAVPVTPGQPGVPGQFLAPYQRDFFSVDAR